MSHQLFEKLRGNTFQIVLWKQHYNYMKDYYDIKKKWILQQTELSWKQILPHWCLQIRKHPADNLSSP